MRIRYIVIILIVISMLERAAMRKKFKTLLFRTVETNFNAEYVDAFVANITSNHYALTTWMRVIVESPADFWMQVSILFQQPASSKFRPIFSYDINLCNVLGKQLNKVSLVHQWMSNLLKYSNMPRTCPWKADTYYWRNFRPDRESIPVFIMSGAYRINSRFYFRDLGNALFTNLSMLIDIKV